MYKIVKKSTTVLLVSMLLGYSNCFVHVPSYLFKENGLVCRQKASPLFSTDNKNGDGAFGWLQRKYINLQLEQCKLKANKYETYSLAEKETTISSNPSHIFRGHVCSLLHCKVLMCTWCLYYTKKLSGCYQIWSFLLKKR